MTRKELDKKLKEFPWLWAIHSFWHEDLYEHISPHRAEISKFTALIAQDCLINIWLKFSDGKTSGVIELPAEIGKTAAEIIANYRLGGLQTEESIIIKSSFCLEFIALAEMILAPGQSPGVRKLYIYKPPIYGSFKQIFAPYQKTI